eukprot:gene12109-13360_t
MEKDNCKFDTPCCSLEVHRSVEDVLGAPTLCLQVGQNSSSDFCAVVITGNPGLIEFYEVFMLQIHKISGCQLQVIGLSQAGHSPIWRYNNNATDYKKADYKSLDEQVEHKKAFIEDFVPKNKKIILIGHSIGAYIVLRLMDDKIVHDRVIKCLLLFPTLEKLTQTPNGTFWAPVSYYLRHPFAITAWILSHLPEWVQRQFIDWRTTWKGRKRHPSLHNAFLNCINYTVINNALFMAAHEMEDVTELGENITKTIEDNLDKITFYYGSDDKWAPPHFYQSMKERYPTGDIRLCQNGFAHDFVVDNSEEVAELVWDMVSHLIYDE